MASESDHWYTQDGKPMHTIIGKNGKERPTTLRDARKLQLVPSVTSVMNVMAAPGLDRWKTYQVLDAAWNISQTLKSKKEWEKEVLEKSKEIGKEAAERGTQIHGYLEALYQGQQLSAEAREYAYPVAEVVTEWSGYECLAWNAERTFSTDMGYGGTVDVYMKQTPHIDTWDQPRVVDFKTKDFGPDDKKPVGYETHAMQLAAYRMGLGLEDAICANVFVSRTHPGVIHLYEWAEEEIQRGWEMFQCCLGLWRALKRYEP